MLPTPLVALLAFAPSLIQAIHCDTHAEYTPGVPNATLPRSLAHSPAHWKRQNGILTVDLWVHVIAASDKSREDGWVSNSTIDQQIDILQSAFRNSSIAFRPVGRTFTINEEWTGSIDGTKWERDMKTALRKGDYRTVNLFIQKNLGRDGRCPNPESRASDPDRFILDGCVIAPETLPGGPEPDTGEGKTAVHEIGHWFGLYHTFEDWRNNINGSPNGCYGEGDRVEDTPPQRGTTSGIMCGWPNVQNYRDSCPQKCKAVGDCVPNPEGDPLNNYMGYCPDRNLTEFTAGQATRMFRIYDTYRKNA